MSKTSISTRQDQSGTTQQHKMAYFGTIQVLGQDHYATAREWLPFSDAGKDTHFSFPGSGWINTLQVKKILFNDSVFLSHGNSAADCQSFVWDNFNIFQLSNTEMNPWSVESSCVGRLAIRRRTARLLCGVLFQRGLSLRCRKSPLEKWSDPPDIIFNFNVTLTSCWAQFWVVFRNEFLVISMYDSESGGLSGIWILYDFGLQHLMLRNLPSLSLMFPPKIDVSTVLREAFAHQNFTVVFDTGSGNLIVETQVLIVSETSLGATDLSRPALIITLIVIFFWFGDKVPGKDCTSDASSSVEFRSMPCFYAHKVSCIENIGMQHWPNFSPSLMHFNCLIMII